MLQRLAAPSFTLVISELPAVRAIILITFIFLECLLAAEGRSRGQSGAGKGVGSTRKLFGAKALRLKDWGVVGGSWSGGLPEDGLTADGR